MEEEIKIAVESMMKSVPDAKREEVEKVFRDYFEKGIPLYQAMGIDKEFMKYIYATGYQLFQAGKYTEALASFQLLATYDPDNPTYMLGQALCFKEMKKFPNAISGFIQYAMRKDDDPLPYWYMYECFEELDEPWGSGSSLGAVIHICNKHNVQPELKKLAELALVKVSEHTHALSSVAETKEKSKK